MKQKTYIGFMWQCSCGHIEYNDESPEECVQCLRMDSFVKLPEEIVEERIRESAESDPFDSVMPKNKKIKKTKLKSRKKK